MVRASFLGASGACALTLVHGHTGLEEEGSHAAHLTLLLDEDLEVLVDDGDCQQDPSSRSYSTQEVSQDGEGPNAKPTKGRSCGDIPGDRQTVVLPAEPESLIGQLR